jgi:hypothetical protein
MLDIALQYDLAVEGLAPSIARRSFAFVSCTVMVFCPLWVDGVWSGELPLRQCDAVTTRESTMTVTASTTSLPTNYRKRRRFARACVVLSVAGIGVTGIASSAEAAPRPRLPIPTQVVVSNVTSAAFSLNIGGATLKTYDVFTNGRIADIAGASSSSVPLRIGYLVPNTIYSVRVRENRGGAVSALSAPISVRTLPAIVPSPVTNLRATSVTPTTINIAWTASSTPNVGYNISLNGVLNQGSGLTSASIQESIQCYPNPCPETGPKPGQNNVITIVTISNVDFSVSAPVELTVFVPAA